LGIFSNRAVNFFLASQEGFFTPDKSLRRCFMKRWLMVLMAAVLSLCVVGSALAAGVPKTLCYSFNGGAEQSLLLIKSAGSIKTAGGTIKYYSISGTHFNHKGSGGTLRSFPVTGSGYLLGTLFHFTYTGMNSLSVAPYYGFHTEGRISNVSDLTIGDVSWGYYDYNLSAANERGSSLYTLIDPTTVTLPYSIQDPGQEKQQ
jgi:hypothetical protein